MIDIETLGTASDTVVFSVGACMFDKNGVHDKFYSLLNQQEQIKLGRTVNEDTLAFWNKQAPEARQALEDSKTGGLIPKEFFESFEDFIDFGLADHKQKRDELRPWGNGASFDITIMEDFYRRLNPKGHLAIPWKFWNVWCYRTFSHITKCRDILPKRHGVYHNALDDAIHQANTVIAVWNKGKK
jgi:exodeoxyribonuclease VIII